VYGQQNYGTSQYGDKNITDDDITTYAPDLMRYLPWYYKENKTMTELQSIVAQELGKLAYNTDNMLNQLFIDTATWGLSMYEKELGLQTNMFLSYEERREIVKAKLRGRGTTTVKMIKDTAETFSGGEVEVIEYPAENRFVIKFIGVKGIPRNMQSFINMLETIKPAHLAYEIQYTFTVWDFVNQLTWESASQYTWNELKNI